MTPPDAPSYGSVYALIDGSETVGIDGSTGPAYLFGASLFPLAKPKDPCHGALARAGACCFTDVPLSTSTDGGLPGCPGSTAGDGGSGGGTCSGPAYTMVDAGDLSLTDGSLGKTLGKLAYGVLPAGFGFAEGYPIDLLNPTTWRAGDRLEAKGSGAKVGPFSAELVAVAMPTAKVPTTLARDKGWALEWDKDANATNMDLEVTASSGTSQGTIHCSVSDAAGGLSVEAPLLERFSAGVTVTITLLRSNAKEVTTSTGALTVSSQALQSVTATIL